jgi:hypothetical protein
VKIRERLSDHLLKLLEHLRLGFEKLVIISLRQDQCRFIRLLNDPDAVIRRKGRNERDCLFDVRSLASEGAVTSEEPGRIDAIRAQRPNPLYIGLLLERGDALQAVRIADAAHRIVLDAEVIEALAERLDALRNEVGDEPLAGHTQRTQILEREPVVTGLLARTLFKVGRDLGPPQLVEAAGGAPEISRRVDRRVIGADQGDDIADERRLRAREALFNCCDVSDKGGVALEQVDAGTPTGLRSAKFFIAFIRGVDA